METVILNTKMEHIAIVLVVGTRFFYGKSKTGRVQTAWSLAGAKMFGDWQTEEIQKAEKMLKSKGYKPERVQVHMKKVVSS